MNLHIDYTHGVYWNGAIHWIGQFCEISYYHIEEERVKFVKSTPHCYEKKWQYRKYSYFKESRGGHLHLIDIYEPCLTKFEVLEMGRDYSGWFVKYNVDLDPLCTPFPGFRFGAFFVLFLDRVENEEEDSSSLSIHTTGHAILCNIKSNTFKSFQLTTDDPLYLVEDKNYLYKETLACV